MKVHQLLFRLLKAILHGHWNTKVYFDIDDIENATIVEINNSYWLDKRIIDNQAYFILTHK